MKLRARCILVAIAFLIAASVGRGEIISTRPYPGIEIRTEVRSDPPMHLFVAQIDLTHPKIRIRVAPGGPDPDGSGPWATSLMTPSTIATREGFVLTVNGAFFSARHIKDAEGAESRYTAGVWATASGPAVTDGKVWSSGKKKIPSLVVHKNRRVSIASIARPPPDAWEVVAGNVMLVENGETVNHANEAKHPRTVVGLDARGTKLTIVVLDGRKPGISEGMSYAELSQEMIRLGCRQALNLDGGGSSAMVLRDPATGKSKTLNDPSDGRERAVANVLGVAIDK